MLDPACGSGNFLYLALVRLLDLWKEVSNFMAELGYPRLMPTPDVSPSPAQLHGIKKDAYAHELAQTTIWIGYIQWFIQNGFGFPPEPILRPIDTVIQMDAILSLPLSATGEGPGMGVKRTLTNLYNARPTWLDNAHRKLDAAMFAAYGWPPDLSDDDILARLLALNLERATPTQSLPNEDR